MSQPIEESSKKSQFNLKYVLIVLVLAALTSGGILAYAKYINKQLTSLVNIPEITKDETADWPTYQNAEMGVEFKYPQEYEFDTEIVDAEEQEEGTCPGCSGKKIYVTFYLKNNKENPDFSFVAATKDYSVILYDREFFSGSSKLDSLCLETSSDDKLCKKLISSEGYGYKSEADIKDWPGTCQVIKINNIKTVFENSYQLESAGFPFSLATGFLFNSEQDAQYIGRTARYNESDSLYKGLAFFPYLDIYNNLVKKWENWTTDMSGEEYEKACSEALSYAKNIMENKNLSQRDKDLLKTINQILSTFKFSMRQGTGIIKGDLDYPVKEGDSSISKELKVCAENISTKNQYCIDASLAIGGYTFSFSGEYKIEVPSGDYYVFTISLEDPKESRNYYSFCDLPFWSDCPRGPTAISVSADEIVDNIHFIHF